MSSMTATFATTVDGGCAGTATALGPKVSVIVPCHNYGAYVGQALESILSQTYQNVEAVVVDDGSTDETADAVLPFVERGRVVYIRQEQAGISAARNRGLAAATGDYIAFLDADDYWPHTDQLARHVAYLESHRECGWVFGDARPFDQTGYTGAPYLLQNGYYRQESADAQPCELSPALLCKEGFFIPTGTLLVRKECFEQVGVFDPSLKMFEDVDMWLAIHRRYPIAFVPRVLLARRVHVSNSGSNRFLYVEDLERIATKHNLAGHGVRVGSLARRSYFLKGKYHMRRREMKAAREAFGRSLAYGIRPQAVALYVASACGALVGRLMGARQSDGAAR